METFLFSPFSRKNNTTMETLSFSPISRRKSHGQRLKRVTAGPLLFRDYTRYEKLYGLPLWKPFPAKILQWIAASGLKAVTAGPALLDGHDVLLGRGKVGGWGERRKRGVGGE